MLVWLWLGLGLVGAARPAGPVAGLPRCAPGWKVELVAETPAIKFPTAVACAPDGRVFVGENPIDMTGPPDQPIDRVMCLHPDGRVTIYADRLYCVFGLLYLDGKLYVNHSPKLSVFKDGGDVGLEKKDWFDYKSPRPPYLLLTGSRTHIAANLRLGTDGFIYMAVGDSGLPGVTGTDGSKVELRGGGIVRFRPDGSQLEIFARGTRNHPDMAINAEDEIFTYDNTDDGEGWWTRLSYMADGGFYGYPWDYRPRRPYTLWMITDFGAGSGVGALAYNEDALPPDYYGNCFFIDFARSQVMRLKFERAGASYNLQSREQSQGLDFVTSGGSEFRPLGIDVSPDGMSFYLTDWQTPMANVNIEAGRLLKVTYTGPSRAAPKPAWWISAAQGRKFEASDDALVQALFHPSRSVRVVAQRRLAERGSAGTQHLTSLLLNRSAPAFARWSALWTLDATDGGEAGRAAILAVLQDPDPSLRRQAAKQLGIRRAKLAVKVLIELLKDNDASVRFQASTALGRIGDREATAPLREALPEKDFFVRYALFTALNRIGHADPRAWQEIAVGLQSSQPAVMEGCLFAMRETFQSPVAEALAAFVGGTNNNTTVRAEALRLLAAIARKAPPWDGSYWGFGSPAVNIPPPARTIDWEATPRALEVIRQACRDPQQAVRQVAIEGIQKLRDTASAPILREQLGQETDETIVRALLSALGELRDDSVVATLAAIFAKAATNDSRSANLLPVVIAAAEKVGGEKVIQTLIAADGISQDPEVLKLVLAALGDLKAELALKTIARHIRGNDPGLRKAALDAMVHIGGEPAARELIQALKNPDVAVRKAVAGALAQFKTKLAVPDLLEATRSTEVAEEATLALAKTPDLRALPVYLNGLANGSPMIRQECFQAVVAIQQQAFPIIEDGLEGNRLNPEVISVLKTAQTGSPMTRWLVLGPLDASAAAADPLERFPFNQQFRDANGKTMSWKLAEGKALTGRLNLRSNLTFEAGNTNMVALAAILFAVPFKQQVNALVACEQPFSVWFNGQMVRSRATAAPTDTQSEVVPISIQAGNNVLLVAINQAQTVTNFSLVISKPLTPKELTPSDASPAAYDDLARAAPGDSQHGQVVFNDPKGPNCVRCHSVEGPGPNIGPSLSGVGSKYNRAQLIEAVLHPSRQILNGYQQTMVATKDGETQQGLVRKESADDVVLVDASGTERRVLQAQIVSRKLSDVSLMPEGLQMGLSFEDFRDLIAYLETLR